MYKRWVRLYHRLFRVQTYPDDGVRLTDGKICPDDLYSDSAASGFADVSSVSFVIDLGELHSISTVVARGLSSGSGGAIISSQVAVSSLKRERSLLTPDCRCYKITC